MLRSIKSVKELKDLVGDKIFNLPTSMTNAIDPVTGSPCLFVGINGKQFNLPVGTPTPIPYNVFCVLKDNGILNHYKKYTEGEDFQPL